jgi:hypothetical protein
MAMGEGRRRNSSLIKTYLPERNRHVEQIFVLHLEVGYVVRPENWTNDRRLLCYWLSVQAAELNRLGLSH